MQKDPDVGKIAVNGRRGQQKMRWLDNITDSRDMNLSNSGRWQRTGKPAMLQSMGSQRVRYNLVTE